MARHNFALDAGDASRSGQVSVECAGCAGCVDAERGLIFVMRGGKLRADEHAGNDERSGKTNHALCT